MNTSQKIFAGLLTGLLIGATLTALFITDRDQVMSEVAADKDKPAYWVAPMDPNYRRDSPGQSPMGMDLIPVYNESETSAAEGVFISPALINNLGVRTARARLEPLQSAIRTVGYVQYDEDRMVHIHSRAEGWIEKLYARSTGSAIEKGQPLYALYSPQIVNAQEEFLLALRSDNARLIEASKKRLKVFYIDDSFISQLSRSRQVQQAVTFYAPQSGILHNLSIREGFFIKPETTLMSIAAVTEVWVEAQVFERQANALEVGAAVTIKLDFQPSKSWQGVVDYIYPSLDEESRALRARIRLADENGELKANMFAQIEIEPKPQAAVIVVPKDAVIRTGTQDRVVLALGSGRFKSVAVQLGRVNNQFAEIRSGLEAGDEVVISAQFLLDSESSKRSDFMRLSDAQNDRSVPAVMDHTEMNHEMMDHGAMDHSQINHELMDHQQMDHSQMQHQE